MIRFGFTHSLLFLFIHIKCEHRIAIFDISLRMLSHVFGLYPHILNMFIDDVDTYPLAPTSIVLMAAFHPFERASITSCSYFSFFFTFHRRIFSSNGEVSSKNTTFFRVRLYRHMSGRLAVAQMSAGTWYWTSRLSTKIFQSFPSTLQ